MKVGLVLAGTVLAVAGCGSSEPPNEPPRDNAQTDRNTVFAPLVDSIDRAEGVQQTIDDQAAELRRRLEEAEE
jgi:hypothetical protein